MEATEESSMTRRGMLAFAMAATVAGALTAQGNPESTSVVMVSDAPQRIGFVDISLTGGTPIAGADDDSEHNIFTTIGNELFPAGNVRIANNGVAIAGTTTGDVGFTNNPIAATGIPTGVTITGTHYLFPLWDDHFPSTANTTIWWQQLDGVLYIMWKNEEHFDFSGGTTTFQIQVFGESACNQKIQFLYADTTYSPGNPLNNGGSATIGIVTPLGNVQWSFDTPDAVSAGAVLSINNTTSTGWFVNLDAANFQINLTIGNGCSHYLLAITTHQGSFPNGWLFGIDMPFGELLNALAIGYPFVGELDMAGNVTLGPASVPAGITFYFVGIGLPYGGIRTPTSPTGYTTI
jgi:hypothetical protein